MNKKNLSYVSLAVGGLSCLVAIFYFISGILNLTDISSFMGVKDIIYVILIATVNFLAACGFAFAAFKLVMPFLNKTEGDDKFVMLPALSYFCAVALGNLLSIIFYFKYVSTRNWILLVIGLVGFVLVLLPKLTSLDKKTGACIAVGANLLGFVLAIIDVVYAGGISIATLIFVIFTLVAAILYYVFIFLIENGNINAGAKEETKAVEAEPVKEAEATEETTEANEETTEANEEKTEE